MDALQRFAKDIWVADGPTVRMWGIPLPTRMIVVKLHDDSLWVDSPVAATREQAAQLDAIGSVAHLVSPTPLHDWRLKQWATFFPRARVWKASALNNSPPPDWNAEIDQLIFRGSIVLSEVEFFHKPSRTLILADFIQNYTFERGRPLRNALKRFGGVLGGGSPRDLRFSFVGKRRRRLGQESLHKLLSWDFDEVILAHGDLPTKNARALVERSFRWL
ncbi:MAG TPA: DUF4336 domain-containing protein [Candidatus Cybelea sp.]|nr:DUF4336 domain-containing protein [Candidatus Cybelea sp.]